MVVAIIIVHPPASVKLILYIARQTTLGFMFIFNKQVFVNSRSVIEKKLL